MDTTLRQKQVVKKYYDDNIGIGNIRKSVGCGTEYINRVIEMAERGQLGPIIQDKAWDRWMKTKFGASQTSTVGDLMALMARPGMTMKLAAIKLEISESTIQYRTAKLRERFSKFKDIQAAATRERIFLLSSFPQSYLYIESMMFFWLTFVVCQFPSAKIASFDGWNDVQVSFILDDALSGHAGLKIKQSVSEELARQTSQRIPNIAPYARLWRCNSDARADIDIASYLIESPDDAEIWKENEADDHPAPPVPMQDN